MTGKGGLTRKADRRFKALTAAFAVWIVVVSVLGGWWGTLVLKQAAQIAELEEKTGMSVEAAQLHWQKTQRMLFWESSTFFLLLFGSSAVLVWLYLRDTKRTRALQAFFASFTHELRTPLTSIRLQAESISENLAPDAGSKILVDRLLEDAMKLESQVERTLELARVEGGGPLYTQPVQLKSWMDRMLVSWRSTYNEKVRFELEIQDCFVDADPSAMAVILRNLVENSIRHSQGDPLVISLKAAAIDRKVQLSFHDNGAAFSGSTKTLGKIFQKGPRSQGAGVGLYLIDALMRRMGGAVRFAGGQGFEVSLLFKEGQSNG
jgi:signal transduction histidine kinase